MHQCVRCGKVYDNAAKEILEGCSCGSKFFFFIKKDALKYGDKLNIELNAEERKQIEKDVRDIIGTKMDPTKPVILNLENIRVLKPGQYELDLVELFKGNPLVYKLEEGKYMIDLATTFKLGDHK